MVSGCGLDAVVEREIRPVRDRGRACEKYFDAPVLCLDKGIPVGCEFMTVLEEFQIPFYINADLDKPGMAVDPDAIRFRLLDLNPFFKNDSFIVWVKIRHRNILERSPALLSKDDKIETVNTELTKLYDTNIIA